MKYQNAERDYALLDVAPFTGAWIEILYDTWITLDEGVAPFTGAWIEIVLCVWLVLGLFVAPFTGAWIEIA